MFAQVTECMLLTVFSSNVRLVMYVTAFMPPGLPGLGQTESSIRGAQCGSDIPMITELGMSYHTSCTQIVKRLSIY